MKTLGEEHHADKLVGSYSDPLEAAILKTFPGMAHIAGRGPEGKTCRECRRWRVDSSEDPHYTSHKDLKPAACGKFIAMMGQGLKGSAPQVPPDASACVFFEDSKIVPPMRKGGRS